MRLERVESLRIYATILIVFAHSQFFIKSDHPSIIASAIKIGLFIIPRFTMPVFFILAGYFLSCKIHKDRGNTVSIAATYTRKIFILFVLALIFYLFETPLYDHCFSYGLLKPAYWTLASNLKSSPLHFLMVGPRVHLWFMTSLIITVWTFACFSMVNKVNRLNLYLYFGISLYAIGLLLGPYNFMPVNLSIDSKPEFYALYGVLYFAIGAKFGSKLPQLSQTKIWALSFAGLAIYCLEVYLRWHYLGADPIKNDFLIGMVPGGIGVFLLAMNKQKSKIDSIIAPFGKFTLGIYLIHFLFIDLFSPFGTEIQPLVWMFLLPVASFACSLLTTMFLSRIILQNKAMGLDLPFLSWHFKPSFATQNNHDSGKATGIHTR